MDPDHDWCRMRRVVSVISESLRTDDWVVVEYRNLANVEPKPIDDRMRRVVSGAMAERVAISDALHRPTEPGRATHMHDFEAWPADLVLDEWTSAGQELHADK